MSKPSVSALDGRLVAQNNELNILQAIRHFGHLRRIEISAIIWPNSSARSAYVMAQRTLNRLLKSEWILARNNALGDVSYILGAKGVEQLRNRGYLASEGYFFSVAGTQFYHRTLGTNYLISRAVRGDTIFGEYAIKKNWSPLVNDFISQRFRKIPDGLVLLEGPAMAEEGVKVADWIEVESAYKGYEEIKKSFRLLIASPELTYDGTVVLNRLVFVYDKTQGHEYRILNYLKQFLNETPSVSPELVSSAILMARCDITRPFRLEGVEELTALEIMESKSIINPRKGIITAGITDSYEQFDDEEEVDFEQDEEVVEETTLKSEDSPMAWQNYLKKD